MAYAALTKGGRPLSVYYAVRITDLCQIANISGGKYIYMSDLWAMEETATYTDPQCFRPATPLITAAWEQALEAHPDPAFSYYIMSGLPHWGREGMSVPPARSR